MALSVVPPLPRRAMRTSQDAGAAFAVIVLAAIVFLLFPGPPCFEGGASAGRPFPYYAACNGPAGTDPIAHYEPSALVADSVFWGIVAFGLAYTWKRRAAMRRAELTPAAPTGPGPAQPPPPP